MIENLTNLILDNNMLNTQVNASAPVTTFQLLKLYIDPISDFNDSNNFTLEIFFQYCNRSVSKYVNPNADDPINSFLKVQISVYCLVMFFLKLSGKGPS